MKKPILTLALIAGLLPLSDSARAQSTNISYTGSLQTYTITTGGVYTITYAGGAGGSGRDASGGDGAVITVTGVLSAGSTLEVAVGGAATSGSFYVAGMGGGGGTFLYLSNASGLTPLLVAGGGGGAGRNNNGANGGISNSTYSAGGSGGAQDGIYAGGGGGGGFGGNGANGASQSGYQGYGGSGPSGNFIGGAGPWSYVNGAYGGGGGGGNAGGGGGGGYGGGSGGAAYGGGDGYGGGGGSSYWATNTIVTNGSVLASYYFTKTAAAATTTGNGFATLTFSVANLYVTNGSTMYFETAGTNSFSNTYVGYTNTDSNNSLVVSGPGVIVTNSANVYVGFQGSSNSMIISNGGTVSDSNGWIGYTNTSSNNSVTVNGGTWSNSGYLIVGNSGSGSLTMGSGTVSDATGYIGNNSGSTGLVTMTGGLWSNSGDLNVGYSGTGSLTIVSGTISVSGNSYIGYFSGSTGSVTMTGGLWSNSSTLVGYSGTGSLTIGSGTVSDGYCYIGNYSGSTGSVTMTGGLLSNSGDLNVGYLGTGSLTIGSGTVSVSGDSYIGNYSGSTGSVTMTGGLWINSFRLYVGNSGTGSMTIGGGTVSDATGCIGNNSGSTGSVTMSGGLWINSFGLYVGNSGTGSLTIGSGTVSDGYGYIGYNDGSTGSVTMTGGLWSNSGDLIVGNSGTGSMTISGGTVSDATGYIGYSSNATGSVSMTGGLWSNSGDLIVGNSGSGSLTMGSGTVSDATGYIGNNSGSTGSVTMTGGLWSNSGYLFVGVYGTGSLTIGSGTVSDGYGYIGYNDGSTGSVTMTGGLWSNSGGLYVGIGGSGSMTISGGTVSDSTGHIGYYSGSTGSVTMTGGLWSNSDNLTVGNSGTGSLTINGGMLSDQYAYLGNNSGSTGSVTMSGGLWSNSSSLVIGNSGTGSLMIGSGTLSDDTGVIGYNSGSKGSVTMSGGLWSNNNGAGPALTLGYAGAGSLTLLNGASLVASNIAIALQLGSIGTLNIGSIGGSDSYTGTITASTIAFGSGSGTINFNQTDSVTISAVITDSGNGSLNQFGSGTTIMTGSNSGFSGLTTITNGTLQFGDGSTTGGSPVAGAISNNASLVFIPTSSDIYTVSGSISGAGTLSQFGSGTTILTGSNSGFSGLTTITNGTLQFGDGSTTGGSPVTGAISNNASLVFAPASTDSYSVQGSISGSGSLSQIGSGTTILAGLNSYTGTTLITNGTLLLTGTNTGSGSITVSGGTFGGTGFATNSAVALSGGAITPGTGGSVGTLSIGSLNITSGTLNILLGGVGGNTSSLLAVNGNATLGGLLSFNTGSFTNAIYTFLTDTNGSISGTFSSTTNIPSGYQIVYSSNSVYLQLVSQLGPVATSFAGTNAVITGGSTNFIVTVTNNAPSGSDNLVFTGTNGTNVSGSIGSTTVTPQGSTNISGVFSFNGTNVGSSQQGVVTINSTNSIPSSGTGTVTVDVYGHAAGSALTNTVALSNVIVGYSAPVTANIGISNSSGFLAGLFSAATNSSNNLSVGSVTNVAAGTVSNAVITLATNQGVGAFTNTINLIYGDSTNLSGALSNVGTNTLTVTENVYGHAAGSLISSNIALSNVIVGYIAPVTANVGISNSTGFVVGLFTTNITSSNGMSLSSVTNITPGEIGASTLTLATGQGTGTYTNTIQVVYGDSTNLAGATATAGTNILTATENIYGHAAGSLTSSNVVLQSVHVGYTNAQINLIGVSNALGFDVAMQTAATNSSNSLSLTGVTGVSNGVSSNATLNFATGQGMGAFTNVIGVVYGDSSILSGNLAQVGTNFLTVSGLVYSGQSTWTAGSGNWTNFSNWNLLGGTPGLDGALSVNDTATFDTNGVQSGTGTVTLNTNATLSSLTFSNATASYLISGSGTIVLQTAGLLNNLAGSNGIATTVNLATNVTLTNNGTLSLVGNINGTGGLTQYGTGTTILAGSNTYLGQTILDGGTTVVTGSVSNNSGLYVGHDNTGVSLVISNGASFANANTWIGFGNLASGNSLLVTGSNSLLTNSSILYVGNNGSGNSLTISSRGTVVDYFGAVGNSSNSFSNTVTVTGSNSSWTNLGGLFIGNGGGAGNTLVISNGASVVNLSAGTPFAVIGYESSNNSVVVTGSNSTWSNSIPNQIELQIGQIGSGNSLVISDGGHVIGYQGEIGRQTNAFNNSVLVTGSNSLWTNAGNLFVGVTGFSNSMVISNQGAVSDVEGVIGSGIYSAANNSVLVTGSNSLWINSGDLTVGNQGASNTLVISNGGSVSDSNGWIGYNTTSTNNSVSVIGGTWSNSSALTIGNSGTGTLTLGSGTISDANGILGGGSGSLGVVSVIGGLWSNSGDLIVGNSGSGSLTMGSGTVSVSGNSYIGYNSGSKGSVTMSGGLWSNSGDLYVGYAGSGNNLTISNQGTVSSVNGWIGFDSNSANNSVLVTGSNSLWTNSGDLYIGVGGGGNSLTVSNAGGISCGSLSIGGGSGSNNFVIVTGTNSKIVNTGDFEMNGGGTSTNNMMVISNGGVVSDVNATLYGNSNSGSYEILDSVYIKGAGSAWSNSTLTIGGSGGAYVTVCDGATLTASNGITLDGSNGLSVLIVGDYTITNGIPNYDSNGTGGSIVAPSITFTNGGSLGIGFVQAGTSTLTSSVSGYGQISQLGTGTSVISGNNAGFSGLTIISAGTLQTASTNALGSSDVTLGGDSSRATLSLATNLTIHTLPGPHYDLVWGSNGVIAMTPGAQALSLNGMTNAGGGEFDFGNFSGSGTNVLINFNFQDGFTTNSFSALGGASWGFEFLSNYTPGYSNSLVAWLISGGGGLVASNTGTTISGAQTNASVTFQTNGILTIASSGNLTITTNVVVNNNGTVNLNGQFTTPNLTIQSGSALAGSGGTLNGNLTIQKGGAFVVQPGQSPVTVNGTATLGGSLVIASPMAFGTKQTFLSATSISGAFDSIITPAGERGRLVIEGDPTASILIAPASYTQMAQNQNQVNVATALNSFIPATSGDQLVISTSLDSLTASQYNQAFNAIMPTFYQQMATIAFNEANALNMELNQRLWGVRLAEGGGFSMSGLADNYPMIQEGQGDGSGKGVLDSKKDILRPGLDNHWGMFVDGNGIFAQANSANMLPGYNSESGGITTGLTYKWNDKVASGIYAGYQGTYTKSGANGSGLGTGSSLTDNAVRFGVFGTYGNKDGKGLYLNGLAGGAYHNYQATRVIQYTGVNRTANSQPGAGELDSMLATGYDIQRGKFTFGPTASLQYTYLGVNSLNETGAQSLNYNSGGWNSSSMLSSVGAHAAYNWVAHHGSGGDIVVVPQINLNWQHEFMQNPYDISGNLGGTSPTFSNWSAAPIRDFLYTGVGFTVDIGKRWNTSFFYNAAAGNQNLTSQNIFWSAGVKF